MSEYLSSSGAAGCPFATMPGGDQGPRHRRLLGLWRNPSVRREIASLDARRDCQRIVHLLGAYEFPADILRSTELALFHTYGSQSIAALLDRTGQFSSEGQKRYDDTRLLIAQFMESGWASDAGRRAIEQMNHIHSFFRIDNEDFLFVLWTFIDFPGRWLDEFGWRRFTAHEREAWFHYWVEIGHCMNLKDIPLTPADFDAFVQAYEARKLQYAPANERVAQATLAIMAAWFPGPLAVFRGLIKPVVAALVPPRLLPAIGMQAPAPWVRVLVRAALRLRAFAKRWLPWEAYPSTLANTPNRTYPGQRYRIEDLGPLYAHRAPPEPHGESESSTHSRVRTG